MTEKIRKNVKKRFAAFWCVCLLLCAICVPVGAASAKITLNKTKATICVGDSLQLKATITGSTGSVKWKSGSPSIASVSTKGIVKAKKAGTATITATVGKKTAKCTVTVKKKAADYVKTGEYMRKNEVGSNIVSSILDKPSDYLLVLQKKGTKIKFLVGHYGINGSPLYETNVITATVKNNRISSFKWRDSWGNEGKGTVIFKKNQVKVKMKTTSFSSYNRWGWWQTSQTISYKGKLTKNQINSYLNRTDW